MTPTLAADIRTVLADEMAPRGWTVSRATTPSGKTLFRCDACDYLTPAPSLHSCPQAAAQRVLTGSSPRDCDDARRTADDLARAGDHDAAHDLRALANHDDDGGICDER